MSQIKGKRVLVTGASGLVAFPVAAKLAEDNEVFAVARFSDPAQKRMIEQAGAQAVSFDLANPDLSSLPDKIDVVINYAVLPPKFGNMAYDVNTGATGRLARRYRDAEAFVHGSTGSAYAHKHGQLLTEDDPYGLHHPVENYAASKIASEYLLRHLSEDYGLPVTIVRIFSFYGPRGGAVTQRIDQVLRGEPVSVYPGEPNLYTPLYEDDYVEKTIGAATIAKVGVETLNVGGSEAVTIQEYCRMAGEMVGKEPTFVENSSSWSIAADVSKMERLLGPSKVSVREGVRRVIESADQRLSDKHHVLGEPAVTD
jgi:nucleoside-diphosphate-sugar epimerase